MRLNIPNIDIRKRYLDLRDEVHDLKSYIYQLVDELRFRLDDSTEVLTADNSEEVIGQAVRSANNFGIFGSSTVGSGGTVTINIGAHFAANSYYVFLQKRGSGDLYVSNKAAGEFTVTGTAGLPFDYIVKIKL